MGGNNPMTSTPNDAFGSGSGVDPIEPLGSDAAEDYTYVGAAGPDTGDLGASFSGSYESSASDGGSGGSSPSDTARQEAQHLKETTASATQHVAGTAMDQAGQVASTAKDQAGQLVEQTRQQLTHQVSSQRDSAVGALRSMSEEFQNMADQCGRGGPATQLVRQGAGITGEVASFLEQREPHQLLDEVRGLARRRPGTFLLGAAVAGMVAGRLTRGAISANRSDGDGSSYSGRSSGYQPGIGTASYGGGYAGGMAEPVATPSYGTMPPPAPAPMTATPPPLLEEPYTGQPPAGYSPGSVSGP
jgi:hypothetical protein